MLKTRRTKLKVFLIVIAMMTAGNLTATRAMAGITGSDHDFSTESWNTTGQICVVCHTPHNANSGITPLWNHATTTSTFTVYTSPSLDAAVGQPSASSKACLSCHDGTVALDSFGGNTGSTTMTGDRNLGTDLVNDHPISLGYDTALATADGGLYDPATASSGLGGTINDDLLLGGKMECASCHDVHNSTNLPKLLVKSNASSALCFTCHSK